MKVKKRFARVAKIFFRIFLDFSREYRLIRKVGYQSAVRRMKVFHERRAQELYTAAVEMGGVLIKLCQYFSARRDVFPDEYIKILSPLQDSVPPLPFAEIEAVIKSEYGDYSRRFSRLDERPLASASLGQVHRARLLDGREVVLKILKPGIEATIDTDFAILYFVFRLLSRFRVFREHADFLQILSEFVRVTGDELNFRREAYIAAEFKRDFARFDYVSVPEIFAEHCTARIIVMEYLAGDRINNVDSWLSRNNDPALIARRIVELYVEQFLSMRFIHFDPHPGNLLISSDNRIVLVDYGMAGEISDRMRQGLADFLEALIEKNTRKVIDTLFALGFIRKGAGRYALMPVVDYFIDVLLDTVKFDRESYYKIDFSPIREQLVEIVYTQPFNIPIEWAYIGKTLSGIAGLIAQLKPDFNLYGELKPHAERLIAAGLPKRASRLYGRVKTGITQAAAMPERISGFMNNLEMGYFKMKVDYTEIIDKIEEIKGFVIRLLSFIVALTCGISAFIFNWEGRLKAFLLFLSLGAAALLVFLVYRKKTIKDRIRKYF
jgi:predicted unusual protein kinase regulating ubiquinone biosynthesis (AarF/ABC1/UbiB family)